MSGYGLDLYGEGMYGGDGGPIAPPVDGTLAAAGMVAEGAMGAPWIVSADAPAPPDMTATLVSFPDRVVLGEFDQVAQEWDDVANGIGSGKVTVDRLDPIVAVLDEGQLVEHRLFGQLVYTSVVESWDVVEVTEAEETGEVCTVSGRGHLSILELGIVQPLILTTGPTGKVNLDRVFNWASPDFPDGEWTTAVELKRQGDDDGGNTWPTSDLYPSGWPWPDAYWILSRPLVPGTGTTPPAPVGPSYYRRAFTLDDPMQIRVYIGADDEYELWIDGVEFGRSDPPPAESWGRTQKHDLVLPAGDHVIAVKLTNNLRESVATNAAGLIVAAFEIDQRTKSPAPDADPLFFTDDSWLALDYPAAVPGFTPGEIIRIVVDEWKARGGLGSLTLAFDDDVDSAGQPWPTVTDIATRGGTDMATFIVGELGGTYIDVSMLPGSYTLLAYAKGTAGQPRPVDLVAADPNDPRTGSLHKLVRQYG